MRGRGVDEEVEKERKGQQKQRVCERREKMIENRGGKVCHAFTEKELPHGDMAFSLTGL